MRHAVVLAALLACACREETATPAAIEVAYYAAVPSRQLDVLFQIDDSNSTADMQASLVRAIGGLFDSLATLDGGLPDLHVGVVSSDMGTSGSNGTIAPPIGSPGNGGCLDRGDDGALQTSGAPVTDSYLIDESDGLGGRRRNYTGALLDVVGQMIRLGSPGCGFEQPLAATTRALVSDANAGFARNEANLLVVILADEDDCSVRDPAIFGPESADLGPQQSFRCTRFGVECDEPMDEAGPKTNCRPRAGSPYVEDIAPFVDAMRVVRGTPARVAVAAVVGPPEVAIEQRVPPGGGAPQLALAHSCTWQGTDGQTVADPALRIAAAIEALAPNSALASVCSEELAPAVAEVARAARGLYGITCLDTARLGPDPVCSAVLEGPAGETPLSVCPQLGDCFEVIADEVACPSTPDHLRLAVRLTAPGADTFVRAHCIVR